MIRRERVKQKGSERVKRTGKEREGTDTFEQVATGRGDMESGGSKRWEE